VPKTAKRLSEKSKQDGHQGCSPANGIHSEERINPRRKESAQKQEPIQRNLFLFFPSYTYHSSKNQPHLQSRKQSNSAEPAKLQQLLLPLWPPATVTPRRCRVDRVHLCRLPPYGSENWNLFAQYTATSSASIIILANICALHSNDTNLVGEGGVSTANLAPVSLPPSDFDSNFNVDNKCTSLAYILLITSVLW